MPYAPPTPTPDQVPPNRPRPHQGWRTGAFWLFMLGLAGVASVRSRAAADGASFAGLWPLLVPLATYGLVALGLFVLRGRLPAAYRTGELRELVTEQPVSQPAGAPPPIALTLAGTDQQRAVTLGIDEAGLHWRTAKTLLQPAQELDIGWSALEGLSTARHSSKMRGWGLVLLCMSLGALLRDWRFAVPVFVVGAALFAVGRGRTRGSLSLVTETHTLTFVSQELDETRQDAILAAVRARRPEAMRPPASSARNAAWLLLVQPFVHLADLGRGEGALRARLLRDGAQFPDEETAAAAVTQRRMFSLWDGGLRALGPLSAGAAALLSPLGLLVVVPAVFGAWVLGLLVLARSTPWFARFSGMRLVR